ncbi:deoxyhypusine hydroxylase-like protein [Leptotrombidium deliense]|uniref:Deoxyhypusine hydroxylase n=1 Tax=Leptotrombidium deliense TaxID=299467 RepID=A0A443SNZ2_9ACAR|nr:deoxyhypusine hydroxylase-like protein [Leptotrombidium deliense]
MLCELGNVLNDNKQSLANRFRALFALRNDGSDKAVDFIADTLKTDQSALLKHECCFCLGQMQNEYAFDCLVKVLKNVDEHPMVRHEAAEALGAIGSPACMKIVQQFCDDNVVEVAQTCQLAVERINWLNKNEKEEKSIYNTVDPTPAAPLLPVVTLKEMLISQESSLYDKYRAMFALRNNATDEAVVALGEALVAYKDDPLNALLKHEIAFVLGQIQSPVSVKYLKTLLSDLRENEMVRHECAEALGSIANDEANVILDNFKKDEVDVVRESVEIALDMAEYENSDSQFLFLDDLVKNEKSK